MTTPVDEISAVGEVQAAPVAPAKGNIEQPPGSAVVVVLQKFWDSPTIKAFRAVAVAAWGAFAMYIVGQIIGQGGIDGIDWHKTQHAAVNVLILNLALGFAAWWKTRDNNPTNTLGKKEP